MSIGGAVPDTLGPHLLRLVRSTLPDALRLEVGPRWTGVSLDRIQGSANGPAKGNFDVPPGRHLLIANRQGTLLLGTPWRRGWQVFSPRSFAYVSGASEISAVFSRDRHDVILIAWNAEEAPALTRWAALLGGGKGDEGRLVRAQTCMETASFSHLDEIGRYFDIGGPQSELAVVAAIHNIAANLFSSEPAFSLVPTPPGLPGTIRQVLCEVSKKPHDDWTLKSAAELAGYSPYHLSRTFKALVGYGFPEYVDRCRTEVAVKLLAETKFNLDEVALRSGFGSTNAMREAMKKFIGLLPSEIRTEPELTHLTA